MNSRRIVRVAGALILLSIAACGGGGGGGGGTWVSDPGTPKPAPVTGQILREDVLSLVPSDFSRHEVDGSHYTFYDPSDTLRQVASGDIVLYREPPGFLRRVSTVIVSDPDQVILATTGATMTDAFQEAVSGTVRPVGEEEIDLAAGVSLKELAEEPDPQTRLTIDKEKTLYFPKAVFDLRKELLNTSSAQVQLDGNLTIQPSFYLDLYVDDDDGQTKLREAELTGSLHAEGFLKAIADVHGKIRTTPVNLFKRSKWFHAGPYVVGRVILEANAFVDVSLDGHARAEASLTGEFAIGAKYDQKKGWYAVNDSSLQFTSELDAGAEGEVRPTVEFTFNVEFYGVADTGLVVAPYLALHGASDLQQARFDWDLTAGIEGRVFVGIGILDYDLARWESSPFSLFRKILTSGSSALGPAAPTGLAATANSEGIRLEWLDRSDDEQAFEIESRVSENAAWSRLAVLGANTTTYLDRGPLQSSTIYQYRVRATSISGRSGYSDIADCQSQSVDDYGDTASTSEHVMEGRKSGALEDLGDVDFFRFVPTYKDGYRFRTYGQTDTEMTLYSAAGKTLVFNDDRSKGDQNSEVSMPLLAGESYYVAVRGFRNQTRGPYSLEISGTGGKSASAPGIGFRNPKNGTVSLELTGTAVTQLFEVNVTDADGDAAAVEWTFDGKSLGNATAVSNGYSGTSKQSISFTAIKTHVVKATAVDKGGSRSPVLTFSVTVRKPVQKKSASMTKLTLKKNPVASNEFANLTVNVTRSGTAPFAGGKVTFTIDGKYAGEHPMKTGQVGFTVPPSAAGSIQLKTAFTGDANYLDSVGTATLTVTKTTPTLITGAANVRVGDSTWVVGSLMLGSAGIEGKWIKLYIDNSLIDTVKTSQDGAVTSKYWPSTVGSHTVRAEFAGDAWMDSVTAEKKFTAWKKATAVTMSFSRATGELGETTKVSGKLTWSGGSKPVAKAKVDLYVGGTRQLGTTTGTDGSYSMSITPGSSDLGTATWKVAYTGDSDHESCTSASQSYTVKDTKAPGQVTLSGPANNTLTTTRTLVFYWKAASDKDLSKNLVYEATLDLYSSSTGKYVGYQSAKTYLGTTQFTFTLPQGNYRWRVRATDSSGNQGAYSNYWYLTVK